MKLYININGQNIQSTENILVVGKPEDAIINKFYSELVRRIVEGMTAPRMGRGLVTDFEANNKEAFAKITEQWELVKQVLLGKNPTGTKTIILPEEYIDWLKYHSNPVYNEIAKSLVSRGNAVEINIEKIYTNAIGLLVNNIESSKQYDQFVVNDNLVGDDSAISIDIRKKIGESVPFVAFVDFEIEPQKSQRKWYNLFELCYMSSKELKQFANEIGINDNFLDCNQLIYEILDYEVEHHSIVNKGNEITVDWDDLFPVFGVTLGETDINGIAEKKNLQSKIEKEGSKRHGYYYRTLVLERKKRFVSLRQYEESSGVHSIVYGSPYRGDDARFPEKWRKAFGFELGTPSDVVKKELKKRGVEILNREKGDEYEDGMALYVKTPDGKFLFTLDFSVIKDSDGDEKYKLNSIEITRGECPYCESKDFEMSFKTKGPAMIECNNCGREWLLF